MKVKVSELSGDALDWAVASVEGLNPELHGGYIVAGFGLTYYPSRECRLFAGLINQYKPELSFNHEDKKVRAELWIELPDGDAVCGLQYGETYPIALCRAVVQAKAGDEFEIPDELMGNHKGESDATN